MTASFKQGRARLRASDITAPAIVLVTAAILTAGPAGGDPARDGAGIDVPVPQPILTENVLLGEAKPDECFVDVGVDYPPINPDGTCNEGTPKTNESYIWGLTEESGKLFFGTMANTACIVDRFSPGLTAEDAPPIFINPDIEGMICEYGESQYARQYPALPDGMGDWRPPKIYEYDLTTSQLTQRQTSDGLLRRTLGFRGAGSIDNIAFLGGQSLFNNAFNLFAFRADTGEYLGSCEKVGYNYVRQWEVANGVLYVGAGTPTRGAVLRWVGDLGSFDGNFCDDFTEVGTLTSPAANVAIYHGGDGQDRLAATTVSLGNTGGVGVWISPPLGPDGLTQDDANNWRQIWTPLMYDPDYIVARSGYSMGAIVSYGGWVYWGTIHLSGGRPMQIHMNCTQPHCFGPPETPQEERELKIGIHRTASLWRGRNLESPDREIQVLYGESELPACCDAEGHFVDTPTGWTPVFGPAGFGNFHNEYIWRMAVFDGRLYVGTYDASVFQDLPDTGADLWRFDSPDTPAVNEDYQGLGDIYNYGIRGLIALDDGSALIVGMANPFNLREGGGWELRRLSEPTAPAAQ